MVFVAKVSRLSVREPTLNQAVAPATPLKLLTPTLSSKRGKALPPNRVILQPKLLNQPRLIHIPPIEYHLVFQQAAQVIEIRAAELFPFGDDDQRIYVV